MDKKFRLEFSYNSNHLEGNTLTFSDTQKLLLQDYAVKDHSLRELEEMKGHDIAYSMIRLWAKDKERPLTELALKELNQLILVRPFWKDAITPDGQKTRRLIKVGDYKESPNSVRLENGEIFDYSAVIDTPIEMRGLMQWYREEGLSLHPCKLAAMLHYKFVRIHPFDDGNGRVSRLLMNYVLLNNDLPPIIIKSTDKRRYLAYLRLADIGEIDPFIDYISDQLIWSLEKSILAAKGLEIEDPDDLDKELDLLNRELDFISFDAVKASPKVIADTIESTILPLFQMIESKCSKLVDKFFGVEREMMYESSNLVGRRTLGSKDSVWRNIRENWLDKQVRMKRIKIETFYYKYTLKGYKNIQEPSFHIPIVIKFSAYNYSIELQDEPPHIFMYGRTLSDEEIQMIFAPRVRSIIKSIRELNGTEFP
ncbi:MAG: Fic family protein [Saprospiraceae bacterium]